MDISPRFYIGLQDGERFGTVPGADKDGAFIGVFIVKNGTPKTKRPLYRHRADDDAEAARRGASLILQQRIDASWQRAYQAALRA